MPYLYPGGLRRRTGNRTQFMGRGRYPLPAFLLCLITGGYLEKTEHKYLSALQSRKGCLRRDKLSPIPSNKKTQGAWKGV